ncbi:MAG: phosphotransferase [Oligoflexales bacterium]|nr:phosphotransferase [Oligoflexales bacterium]
MSDLQRHEAFPCKNSIPTLSANERQDILKRLVKVYAAYTKNQEKIDYAYQCEAIEDSNMNVVLKIDMDGQSWLVKHADPWVRKYPEIAAPVSRTKQEADFYQAFGSNPRLQGFMPEYIGYDASENLIALEYIDHATSAMSFYDLEKSQGIPQPLVEQAISYLATLHSLQPSTTRDWSNRELRKLNHIHMFEFPYDPGNGMNLDQICPGLGRLAQGYQSDAELKKACSALGNLYLQAQGPALLHGDFYPGSWLVKQEKVVIIDPEFCFIGPTEFDLGVLLAHHLIIGAQTMEISSLIDRYIDKAKPAYFDKTLCTKFCGAEILRRMLGAAQLPIDWQLERYEPILNLGREYCIQ